MPSHSHNNKLQVNFFYVLLVIISIVCILIFLPYVSALFLAVVFSVTFYPLYRKVKRICFNNAGAASFATLGVICAIILIPLSILGFLLFQEARDAYVYFTDGGGSIALVDYLGRAQIFLNNYVPESYVPETTLVDLENNLNRLYGWFGGHFQSIFSNTLNIIINLVVLILALYFFFKDGHKFKEILLKVSPLNDVYDESVLSRMTVSINSVVKGTLLVAIVQGLLAGIGFWFFDVPSPILWGVVTMLASLVPGLGTVITIWPAALFVAISDGLVWGIGLFLWGTLVVGSIDNLLRPFLYEKDIKIHPFLILLSVFGGIGLFGAIGFLAGPIILSLLFALLEIYSDVVTPPSTHHLARHTDRPLV